MCVRLPVRGREIKRRSSTDASFSCGRVSVLTFRPGTSVVLEGVDGAGKTTQRRALQAARWAGRPPLCAHMPSGLVQFTHSIYDLVEKSRIESPLARQLLHLSAHAESIQALQSAKRDTGLILDRWWWSTVAYGWFGGLAAPVTEEKFFGAVDMVWGGFSADVVFMFMTSRTVVSDDLARVSQGYRWLAERNPRIAVEVPAADPETTTRFLLNELQRRGIVDDGGNDFG